MFCYKCGKKNKESATFCEECGTKLFPKEKEDKNEKEVIKEIEEGDKVISKTAKTAVKATGKAMKFTTKLVISLVIVVAALIGLNYYFTVNVASPDQVVRKAVNSLEKNDIKTFFKVLLFCNVTNPINTVANTNSIYVPKINHFVFVKFFTFSHLHIQI